MDTYPLSLWLLLRKGTADEDWQVAEAVKEDLNFAGIRCPLCRWRPARSSRWVCVSVGHPENYFDGCHARWNTFETRGVCPGCSHQWKWTMCLSCHKASPHEDWYEDREKV